MKHPLKYFLLLLFVSFSPLAFGQTLSSNPAPTNHQCLVPIATTNYCLSHQWLLGPHTPGENVLRLKVIDRTSGKIAVIPTPVVTIWNPGLGHGSDPTTVTQLSDGSFEVHHLSFTAAGRWQVQVAFPGVSPTAKAAFDVDL